MGFDRVAILSVEAMEPLAIRDKYSKGAHYFSPSYIPSSTLSGAIASAFFRKRGSGGNIEDLNLWMSHAFPSDKPFELCGPPPLPLSTLARREDGSYISVALLFANAIERGPHLLDKMGKLDKKVGEVFISPSGIFRPPRKEVFTQVTLSYDSRTHFYVEVGGEKYGLLFTQEVIRPGSKFHSLAFLDDPLYEELKGGAEVRVGAFKRKGFGLVEIKLESSMDFNGYRNERMRRLSDHEFLTVDVVTFSSKDRFLELGSPLYEKLKVSNFKAWLDGKFYIYRGVIGPGSVLVYPRGDLDPERIIQIELTPPPDVLRRFHGLDMIFFDNPIHFSSGGDI
ncbi:RAMP superfamily CRISPR-associated protein [Candidatus Korarchaeum cryptofilum]|jgi:hypothetical protein|nr:RAMP superfamily CRISPR-associated protein [Candidatus Korarchaeum cryptofilum]